MADDLEEPALYFPEVPERGRQSAWCGCASPSKDKAPEWQVERWPGVSIRPGGWKDHPLRDFVSITLTFPYPVEEPFELISPPLP
jgi:hypothetical protein